MTNKKKKRAREHAAATGMSYQASLNALNNARGREQLTVPSTIDVDARIAQLADGADGQAECVKCGAEYAGFLEVQPDGKRGGPLLCHECIALPLGADGEPACECGCPLHRMGQRAHMASSLAYPSSVDGRPLCVDCWGNCG